MYTVGIKRRFWFGFREVRVNSHGWQDGRIILNLIDGSQEQIPGYAVYCLKVYNDFHRHAEMVLEAQREKERRQEIARALEEHELEQARLKAELEEYRSRKEHISVFAPPIPAEETKPVAPDFREQMENEVMRRATQRINNLQS
jgi:hypothetical protein